MSKLNLEGKTFGLLTVIGNAGKDRWGKTLCTCMCTCGKICTIRGTNLVSGNTKSCGCRQYERGGEYCRDISGQRFGRLLVKDFAFIKKDAFWNCVCDCGTEKIVRGASLRDGSTTSCGCYRNEQLRKATTKHGLSNTAEYRAWRSRKRWELKKILDTGWGIDHEIEIRTLFSACVICGINDTQHIEKYGTHLHVDHVVPLHLGYGLCVGNAVILCKSCNSKKSDKQLENLPHDWQRKILNAADQFKIEWNRCH